MNSLTTDLRVYRQQLQTGIDEAAETAAEHSRYYEQLIDQATGSNPSEWSLEEHSLITSEQRKQAHYLARAEALTYAQAQLEEIAQRHGFSLQEETDETQ